MGLFESQPWLLLPIVLVGAFLENRLEDFVKVVRERRSS